MLIRRYVDQFCLKMLLDSQVKKQIYSLKLSNKPTCGQIKIFLSFFSLNEFSNLRILTMIEPNCDNAVKLELMLPLTPQLCCLYLIDSHTPFLIKPLPKLRTLSITFLHHSIVYTPETSSIINLTISRCSLIGLYQLLKLTPMLRYLNIQHVQLSHSYGSDKYFLNPCALHLEQMIIGKFEDNFRSVRPTDQFEIFEMLIKQTPNLKKLTISSSHNREFIDACRWEHLISSSLPFLNTFKFNFAFFVHNSGYIIQRYEQFQTDFWHEQHHWYTEYGRDINSEFIYTIPYPSNMYKLIQSNITYSKCLRNDVNIFDNVINLTIDYDTLTEYRHYYFSNVTSLTLTHPELIKKDFNYLKMIIKLFNLKHLNICYFFQIKSSSILLELLKEAPQLTSLSIKSDDFKLLLNNHELCKYLNKMIRQLDLQCSLDNIFYDLSEARQFCEIFTNIEHLQCRFDRKENVLFLLNHLPKLSTLKVTWGRSLNSKKVFYQFKNNVQKNSI